MLLFENQTHSVDAANQFFIKNPDSKYIPITSGQTKKVDRNSSRELLKSIGINGEIVETLGHSEDSISLFLDQGLAFTGDLPLYELREAYGKPEVIKSWNLLTELGVEEIFPAHGNNYAIK